MIQAPKPHIRDARPGEYAALTDLAMRSKAMWGYSASFMAACRDELRVGPVNRNCERIRVAHVDGNLSGFTHLSVAGSHGEIEAMFVDPDHTGQGIGAALWHDLARQARRLGAHALFADADPNALGFYKRMGMTQTGENPSASIPGRMLPRLEIALDRSETERA